MLLEDVATIVEDQIFLRNLETLFDKDHCSRELLNLDELEKLEDTLLEIAEVDEFICFCLLIKIQGLKMRHCLLHLLSNCDFARDIADIHTFDQFDKHLWSLSENYWTMTKEKALAELSAIFSFLIFYSTFRVLPLVALQTRPCWFCFFTAKNNELSLDCDHYCVKKAGIKKESLFYKHLKIENLNSTFFEKDNCTEARNLQTLIDAHTKKIQDLELIESEANKKYMCREMSDNVYRLCMHIQEIVFSTSEKREQIQMYHFLEIEVDSVNISIRIKELIESQTMAENVNLKIKEKSDEFVCNALAMKDSFVVMDRRDSVVNSQLIGNNADLGEVMEFNEWRNKIDNKNVFTTSFGAQFSEYQELYKCCLILHYFIIVLENLGLKDRTPYLEKIQDLVVQHKRGGCFVLLSHKREIFGIYRGFLVHSTTKDPLLLCCKWIALFIQENDRLVIPDGIMAIINPIV